MKKLVFLCLLLFSGLYSIAQSTMVTTFDGKLYKVDLNTWESILIGKHSDTYNDIAYTTDGRLWGIRFGFARIDTTDGSDSMICSTPGSNSLVGLDDSTVIFESSQNLYRMNVNTGKYSSMGSVGVMSCGDLTWLGKDLYMNSCTHLLQIKLDSSMTSIDTVITVNYTIRNAYGLTTRMIDDHAELVIFQYKAAYSLCHSTGAYKMICYFELSTSLNGAASMPDFTEPVTCGTQGLEENDPLQAKLRPNPVSREDVLVIDYPFADLHDLRATLYNALGQHIETVLKPVNGSLQLDLRILNLIPGIYHLVMSDELRQKSVKFLVY